jgi:hypothetical protein
MISDDTTEDKRRLPFPEADDGITGVCIIPMGEMWRYLGCRKHGAAAGERCACLDPKPQ